MWKCGYVDMWFNNMDMDMVRMLSACRMCGQACSRSSGVETELSLASGPVLLRGQIHIVFEATDPVNEPHDSAYDETRRHRSRLGVRKNAWLCSHDDELVILL